MKPSKAIKIRCKDCQPEERTDTLCSLYIFRLGKNPNRKREIKIGGNC